MPETAAVARLSGLRPRARLLAAGALGAAAGLGQAPVSFPVATLLALAGLFHLFRSAGTARGAFWIGGAAGAGYFALTLSWMVEPFLVDIARHGWMAPFALLIAATVGGLFWGLACALAHSAAPAGWPRALSWAAALAGAELARSYLFTGFPWALIGHVWIGWAPMHLASLAGPHGLTLLTLLLAAMAVTVQRAAGRAVVAVLAAGIFGLGAWIGAQPLPAPDEPRPVIRLVQPNAAQHLKWDPDAAPQFFARQIGFTAAPAGRRPDLIVWPETAIPWLLDAADPAFARIAEAAGGVPVVLGLLRQEAARSYNSLVVLDAAGAPSQLYDKHHLVPFGEYIPAPWLLRPMGLSAFTAQEGFGFSDGPGARLLDLGVLGRVRPLICYEAIFPQDVRGADARPDWLLQITNDAWFGTVSGPYQHLAQARLRAVETGLPMVRVANTGVSAVIDARGEVTASLPLGQAGFLDASLPPAGATTLYWRMGDIPLAVLILALLLGAAATARRNSG